jgi:hypothetical protein
MTQIQGRSTPLEINGKSSFASLEEAKKAADSTAGSEGILQRDDGQFEVISLDTPSTFDSEVTQAHQKNKDLKYEISFADLNEPTELNFEGAENLVALTVDNPRAATGVSQDILVNFSQPMPDATMEKAFEKFQAVTKQEMEKEFRFAPEGSDKWKLFKGMELVAKLDKELSSVKDLEAKQVLQMRKSEIVDLVNQLNQKPEIKEAFARVQKNAMSAAGVSQTDLTRHANHLLSNGFRKSLQAKPAAEQKVILQKELAKIQFFNPEYGAAVAGELGSKFLIEEGLSHLRTLDEEGKAKVKVNVAYLIDDLVKETSSTASNAFKPLRELHKVMTQLHPEQVGRFKEVLVKLSVNIESMDAKGIVNAIKEIEGLPPDLQNELSKLDWHGELRKVLSSVAAVGTLISLGRSVEDMHGKGLTLKTGVDLVKNTASLIGSSKDIAQTAGRASNLVGMESMGARLSSLGKTLDGMKLVKWAGPVASAISGGWDLYEMGKEINNEDKAGAWLKGITATSSLVAAGAGAVAAWYGAGATATAIAGPIGLAAVAVGAAAAVTYSFVAESEETGNFRKDLRALGITDKEEKIESEFQQVWIGEDNQGNVILDPAKGLAWAKDKPVEERARLINALMDQATDGQEEKFINLLLNDAIGKNKDSQGQDDFDRIMSRTDPRRLSAELDDNMVKKFLNTLKARPTPEAKRELEQLCLGLSDGHRLDLLQKPDGAPLDFVKDFTPDTIKDMAAAVMKGMTLGKKEIFMTRLVVDQPAEKLAEVLSRGGKEFIENLVSEIPKQDTSKLLARFTQIDKALSDTEGQIKVAKAAGKPVPELEIKQKMLKHALDVPLNSLVTEIANRSNTWFGNSYQDVIKNTLQPEITRNLSPKTLEHVTRQLMDSKLWTPSDSSKALVKVIQQANSEQFKELMENNTDTYIRHVLAQSLDGDQAQALLERFLQSGSKPDRSFQTFALGLIEKGHEDSVKTFLAARPHLDLSQTPALKAVVSEKSAATLANLVQDRSKIGQMTNEEKAIIVKYLMEGWSTDHTETLIKDILVDTHTKDPAQFKELVSMIDTYKLANELGDFFIDGQGNAESLKVFELIAKDGNPADFEAYATRLGADDNVDVLFKFVNKPENKKYISQLPAKAVKEMSESMMKGYTGSRAEMAITQLLLHSSDNAFTEMLADKDFSSWISKELQTDEANWFTSLQGEADQLNTIMNRLGKMATEQEKLASKEKHKQPLSPADIEKLALNAKVIEATNSFGLAISERDYGRILLKTATSPETEAAVRLISPPVLKAMMDQLMAGYTGSDSEAAIAAMLQKTTPTQLRDLMDKTVGGKTFVADLASELSSGQMRELMEKMISDKSVNAGMGFSYLASKLADEHEGATIRDLIANRPEVVRQIHPTVLQDIAVKLSQGWTSTESQQAISKILTNATPDQLEILMQSNVSTNPQHVSDYITDNLTTDQLKGVLTNFARGKGSGRGLDAYLTSIAHKQPGVLSTADKATLQRLSPESLKIATQESLKAWNNALLISGPPQEALNHLIDASKDAKTLETQLSGLDGRILGQAVDDNQTRFNRVFKQLLKSGNEKQLKDFMQSVSTPTLQNAWSNLKTDRVAPSATARQILFQRFVDQGDLNRAQDMLQGVSGMSGMNNLSESRTGSDMLGYLSSRMGNFNRDTAPKAAAWILANGNQAQTDTAMKTIKNDFYFGRGGEVMKRVMDEAEAQKLDIKGKLSISTLNSMVGALDSIWTKMFGDYDTNVKYVGKLADMVDVSGKAAIINNLMSGWTPGEAETLIHNIFAKTTDPRTFTQLVDKVGPAKISSELEERGELGRVMAFVIERYKSQYSSKGRDDDSVLNEMMNQWGGLSIKTDDVIWQMLKQLEKDGQMGRLKQSINNSTLNTMINWTDDAFRDGNLWDLDPESEWSIKQLKAAKT